MKRVKGLAPSTNHLKSFGYNALCLAGCLTMRGAFEYASEPNINDSPVTYMCKAAFKASGIPSATLKWVDTKIPGYRATLTPEFLLDDASKKRLALEKQFAEIENEFKKQKKDGSLIAANEKYIERQRLLAEAAFKTIFVQGAPIVYNGAAPNNAEDLAKLLNTMARVLAIPRRVKQVDSENLKKKLHALIKNTDKGIAERVLNLGINLSHNSKTDVPSRSNYYFLGPGGTGKSFLAEGIAGAMDVPILKIKFSTDQKFKNQLSEFLATNKDKNSLVVIEEAGDFLGDTSPLAASDSERISALNEFKLLLDPATYELDYNPNPNIYSPGPHPKIDISKVTFVLTGNHKITDPALKRRLDIWEFPRVALQDRERIAKGFWKKETNNAPLTPSDEEVINQIVSKTNQYFDGVGEMERFVHNYVVSKTDKDYRFNLDKEIEGAIDQTPHSASSTSSRQSR